MTERTHEEDKQTNLVVSDIEANASRVTAYTGTAECSTGLSLTTWHGLFFVDALSAEDLPGVEPASMHE